MVAAKHLCQDLLHICVLLKLLCWLHYYINQRNRGRWPVTTEPLSSNISKTTIYQVGASSLFKLLWYKCISVCYKRGLQIIVASLSVNVLNTSYCILVHWNGKKNAVAKVSRPLPFHKINEHSINEHQNIFQM